MVELTDEMLTQLSEAERRLVKAFSEFQYATAGALRSVSDAFVINLGVPDWKIKLWEKKERGFLRHQRAYKRRGKKR